MALPAIPLLLGGLGATIAASQLKAKQQGASVTPSSSGSTANEEATVAAQEATRAKQAAAYLKGRNAQGFEANPNKAKPFLLSL